MPDSLNAGDKGAYRSPCAVAESAMPMRSLGSVVRPLMKALIVDRALSGKITPQEAERLIAAHKLENA